jgi:phospholipid-binding lipoprotein MlaA
VTVRVSKLVLAFAVLCAAGCAHRPPDEPMDPLEPVNRGVYKFNRVADRYVLRPVAKRYKKYTPREFQSGVHNFLDNLFYPTTIVNAFLQGKVAQGSRDVGRFVINTTLGIAGIMDVATPLGLERNKEDLGQTLGKYGFGEGIYLMLPFFGPSNGRDLIGRVGDSFTGPTPIADLANAYTVTSYNASDAVSYSLSAVGAIDQRVGLLGADRMLNEQSDPYLFLRTAYLQRRQGLVYDGNPPKQKFDFDDSEDDSASDSGE